MNLSKKWSLTLIVFFLVSCKEKPIDENLLSPPGTRPASRASSQPATRPSEQGERGAQVKRTKNSVTVLSDVHVVDQIYPSMTGPKTQGGFQITESDQPELLWITGYEAVMKGVDGKSEKSQQYMCHSNLDWEERPPIFRKNRNNKRVFTLSQGQLVLSLPEGFGIPVLSTEWLGLTTQVLNMHQTTGSEEVRHQTTVRFKREKTQTAKRMKPLTYRTTAIRVSLEKEAVVFNELNPTKLQKEASCLPGEDANQGNRPSFDRKGRRYSAHWMVPPGRHRYRTLATPELELSQDTRIHYIAVHAHPFVEYVELRDLTKNESVFRSNAKGFEGSIGIEHIDYYSSVEGMPIYKDHEYEIVSEYNNTSGKPQDAMAVLYIYLYDSEFKHPLMQERPAAEGKTEIPKNQVDIGGIKFLKK